MTDFFELQNIENKDNNNSLNFVDNLNCEKELISGYDDINKTCDKDDDGVVDENIFNKANKFNKIKNSLSNDTIDEVDDILNSFNKMFDNDDDDDADDDDDDILQQKDNLYKRHSYIKASLIQNQNDNNDYYHQQTNNCDDEIDESIGIGPTSERWAPLGADNDDETNGIDSIFVTSTQNSSAVSTTISNGFQNCSSLGIVNNTSSNTHRIKSLEEEQEMLTTSLIALTSHFAQVQFRLRQIVESPPSERDQLLVNLEEFAFRGIPEITGNLNPIESEEVISNLERARQRQFELIDRLKRQLSELEKFAYESGAPVLPQSMLIEKQKILIDEIKNKLNLNVSDTDLPQLTNEDLRNHVDNAIGEFVGPLKMKEQLVAQLKTQITDLERFIAFLQGDTETILTLPTSKNGKINDCLIDGIDAYNSYAAKKKRNTSTSSGINTFTTSTVNEGKNSSSRDTISIENRHIKKSNSRKDLHGENGCNISAKNCTTSETKDSTTNSIGSFTKAHNLLDKAATLLQMFAVAQFGCSSNRFQKNTLKKTTKCNHWGDLRAQLEVDIQEIISLVQALEHDKKLKAEKSHSSYASSSTVVSSSSDDSDTDTRSKIIRSQKQLRQQPNRRSYRQQNYHHKNSSSTTASIVTHNQTPATSCNNSIKNNTTISSNLAATNLELTTIVRKNFACTLQKLIQHGLRIEGEPATNLVPFIGCFNPSNLRETGSYHQSGFYNHHSSNCHNSERNYDDYDENNYYDSGSRQMHAWELILEYYSIKNGDQYNETPARKLSQSFNLDIVGGAAISNKQSLLSVIGSIIAMHSPYKRSYNSHFKAFVCAGLNSQKLVQWLNLIFQCTELIDTYYTSWSYVAKTGFRDSLRSIDSLTKYHFDLPVDLAIRQFQNIKDVFM